MSMFETEFAKLLEKQKREASGQRLEMLCGDLHGTKRMLEAAVWPVKKSLDGFVLEYELVRRSGVKVYIDALETTAALALESEGFTSHAQNITRDRFSFEKRKVRTIAANGFIYTPFSKDELESNPAECSSSFAELIGRYGGFGLEAAYKELNIYEREVIRYSKSIHRLLRPADVCFCLGSGRSFASKVLKEMEDKGLLAPAGKGVQRHRFYELTPRSYRYRL
ncbi:hypothetical protein GE107_02100 [Cohnella sp. CFH 77786]|uniref:hypothetical protein n=1 Tax=Cohnella sp. CFH 77786 TaxID=2662265 RepID=UPI001C609891|nr:hypothetical protein [Cohnella sp. CFH 77786]MBW5444856.1 hypothetical protein [Cohnella sp. CFH 77786]